MFIYNCRFELQAQFNSKEWDSYSIDQILVTWVNATISDYLLNTPSHATINQQQHANIKQKLAVLNESNFHEVFQDGLLLCHVLVASEPNLPAVLDSVDETAGHRWAALLRVIESRFRVPQLLQASEVVAGHVDKVSVGRGEQLLRTSIIHFYIGYSNFTSLVPKQFQLFIHLWKIILNSLLVLQFLWLKCIEVSVYYVGYCEN